MITIGAVLLAGGALLSQAEPPDVYFEQTTVVYVDGKPTGPGVVSRAWYGGPRSMRMEAGGVSGGPALILDAVENRAFRVDPARRRVVALSAEKLRTRAQMDAATAGELMGGGEEGRFTTAPLPRERTIAGYRCRGYRITGGAIAMDLWTTTDLQGLHVDTFQAFLRWSGAADSLGGLLAEIQKLPGFPLQSRTRVTVMGETQETVATVTKIKLGPLEPKVFAWPSDYTLVKEEP